MGTPWYAYPISHGYYSAYHANIPDTPHWAVDIATPMDTPITAMKSGKVVQADYAPWGGEVFVQPDDGSTEYYYYHFDVNEVKAGQHVNAGDLVGLSGGQNSGGNYPVSTEWSTGPHTHVGYFTGYVNTPIGTRPQGPDITSTIQNLNLQGLPSNGGSGSSSSSSSSSSGGSSDPVTTATHALTRIGIFLVALAIIGGGAYLLFQKQINAAVKKGVDTAKVAMA